MWQQLQAFARHNPHGLNRCLSGPGPGPRHRAALADEASQCVRPGPGVGKLRLKIFKTPPPLKG